MKKIIILASFTLCINAIFASDTVSFCSDPWVPFVYGKENDEPPEKGLAVDIVNEVCKRARHQCVINIMPWKRCLKHINEGSKDGITLLTKDNERAQYMDFTSKVMDGRDLLFYRKDKYKNFTWNKWEDLKPYKIGITAGFSYGDEWAKARVLYKLQIDEAFNSAMTFSKLLIGRFDLAISGEGNALEIIKENPEFLDKFSAAPKPINVFGYHIAFSKKSPKRKLIPLFNKALQEMEDDGTLKSLKKKWNFN